MASLVDLAPFFDPARKLPLAAPVELADRADAFHAVLPETKPVPAKRAAKVWVNAPGHDTP